MSFADRHKAMATQLWQKDAGKSLKSQLVASLGLEGDAGNKATVMERWVIMTLSWKALEVVEPTQPPPGPEQPAEQEEAEAVEDEDFEFNQVADDPDEKHDFDWWMFDAVKEVKKAVKRIERRQGGFHVIKRLENRTTCGMSHCSGKAGEQGEALGSATLVCVGCRVPFCRSTHCLNAHLRGVQGTPAKPSNALPLSADQGEKLAIPSRGKRSGKGKRSRKE